jgi:hypothetical protein
MDNDLMDLWLRAGALDGLDKETARDLITEIQQARDDLEAEAEEHRAATASLNISSESKRHER